MILVHSYFRRAAGFMQNRPDASTPSATYLTNYWVLCFELVYPVVQRLQGGLVQVLNLVVAILTSHPQDCQCAGALATCEDVIRPSCNRRTQQIGSLSCISINNTLGWASAGIAAASGGICHGKPRLKVQNTAPFKEVLAEGNEAYTWVDGCHGLTLPPTTGPALPPFLLAQRQVLISRHVSVKTAEREGLEAANDPGGGGGGGGGPRGAPLCQALHQSSTSGTVK